MAMKQVPLQARALGALRAEVAAADRQIAARDTIIAQLTRDKKTLRQIIAQRERQKGILEGDRDMLHKKYRRMRWWRPLALGASAAAVFLAIR